MENQAGHEKLEQGIIELSDEQLEQVAGGSILSDAKNGAIGGAVAGGVIGSIALLPGAAIGTAAGAVIGGTIGTGVGVVRHYKHKH